jgi:hypothetical protein
MQRWLIDYGNITVETDSEYIAQKEQEDGLPVVSIED